MKTSRDLLNNVITPYQAMGNGAADRLADLGADLHQLPTDVADTIERFDAIAYLIRTRCIAIVKDLITHADDEAIEKTTEKKWERQPGPTIDELEILAGHLLEKTNNTWSFLIVQGGPLARLRAHLLRDTIIDQHVVPRLHPPPHPCGPKYIREFVHF